jgi:toxin FitB
LTSLALDTSVAIPLLVQTHREHAAIVRWWNGRQLVLSGHAVAETYSVLTRLPGDVRIAPVDAARLLGDWFGAPLLLRPDTAAHLPEVLARLGISGGAVYDAIVALAAVEHDAELATRDARARATYETVGARVVVAG